MSGIPQFNFPAFHDAARKLREEGHEVFSPAEADNARLGADISLGNQSGDVAQAAREHGFNLRQAIADDLAYICLEADAIALLPGWENSKGANLELHAARSCKLQEIYLS